MVTIEQSMGGSGEVDYADFATQMVRIEYGLTENDEFAKGVANIEPLRGRGGLANNEVAELLYLETDISATHQEGEFPVSSSDTDVKAFFEQEGHIGINTDHQDDPRDRSNLDVEIEQGDESRLRAGSVTDNAMLQLYRTTSGLMFDESGGAGGSFNESGFSAEKYYRETHGRGPVLDQTDDITVSYEARVGDILGSGDFDETPFPPVVGQIALTMYWDVAETSDAGRRFSLP